MGCFEASTQWPLLRGSWCCFLGSLPISQCGQWQLCPSPRVCSTKSAPVLWVLLPVLHPTIALPILPLAPSPLTPVFWGPFRLVP